MPRHLWTAQEQALLCAFYHDTPTRGIAVALGMTEAQVYTQAFRLGLQKSRALIAEQARDHTSMPAHHSHRSRFGKGNVPWNKGTHWTSGGRSAETRFKAGTLNGRAAQLALPVGTLRIVGNNLERKVGTTSGSPHLRWHPVHRLVWIAAHGPVPAGHLVVFRPGMHTHAEAEITVDRLELVTYAENMRRNSVHTVLPPELARVAQLRGALTRQINRRSRS